MSEVQKNRSNEDADVIDLRPLLLALWKRAWLIILVGAIACVGAYGGAKLLVTPTYQSSFTAYVNNRSSQESGSDTLTSSDLSAAKSLVQTYSAVITSRSILESAAQQAGAPYSYQELKEMVSTDTVNDTEIIRVSVTMEDRQMAAAVAEAIAEIAPEYVAQIVEGSSMKIVDAAVIPVDIYSPNYMQIALLGAVLGVLLVAAVIVLKEILDDRVKDEGTLEDRFGIPVIGTIPNMEAAEKAGDSYGYGKRR